MNWQPKFFFRLDMFLVGILIYCKHHNTFKCYIIKFRAIWEETGVTDLIYLEDTRNL